MGKAILPPYGVAIQRAVASGDLAKMRQLQAEAEEYLQEQGNVPAALEALKMEIAKLERKG